MPKKTFRAAEEPRVVARIGLIIAPAANFRISAKESASVAKEVSRGEEIQEQKKGSGDSQCRNSSGIN